MTYSIPEILGIQSLDPDMQAALREEVTHVFTIIATKNPEDLENPPEPGRGYTAEQRKQVIAAILSNDFTKLIRLKKAAGIPWEFGILLGHGLNGETKIYEVVNEVTGKVIYEWYPSEEAKKYFNTNYGVAGIEQKMADYKRIFNNK